jgi:hypothetical protein
MRSSRRDFLRYSSTAAAGFAIAAMSQSSLFAAPQSGEPLLSVGFAPAIPRDSVRLSSASRILSPDPTFLSRNLRLRIFGGGRAARYQQLSGGVAVDAIYPTGNRVLFWSATRYCTTGGASLVLPVESANGVSLSVRNLTAATESILDLGLLTKSNPKLRRGIYVVAVRESANDAAPDWSRFDLVRDGDRFFVANAPVSYAVLYADYAS